MKELNFKELHCVSGGLDLRDEPMSINVIDMRSGYAFTPLPWNPEIQIPNPIVHYQETGRFSLPAIWW